jgi:hypothetical protein
MSQTVDLAVRQGIRTLPGGPRHPAGYQIRTTPSGYWYCVMVPEEVSTGDDPAGISGEPASAPKTDGQDCSPGPAGTAVVYAGGDDRRTGTKDRDLAMAVRGSGGNLIMLCNKNSIYRNIVTRFIFGFNIFC